MSSERFDEERPRKLTKREFERRKKERRKKLFFRRTLIVLAMALILALVVFLVVVIGKNLTSERSVATPDETVAATVATENYDYALTFTAPKISDDKKTTGAYSVTRSDVYVYNAMALETFSGDEVSAGNYADTVSEFKRKVGDDVTVYNMVIPSHIEFALPSRLTGENGANTASQSEYLKKLYSSYSERVIPINCYNKLSEHSSDYIFFNTERYITALGGYYAYTAFCEQADRRTLDLSVCKEHIIDRFEGSLFDADDAVAAKPDSIHFFTFPYDTYAERTEEPDKEPYELPIYYEDEESGPYAYGVFLWGDCPLFVEHNTDISDGAKIAVIKDSAANPFVSYLTADYEQVHIIDYRYYTGSVKEYLKKQDIKEVLIVNSVMSADSSDTLSSLRSIF